MKTISENISIPSKNINIHKIINRIINVYYILELIAGSRNFFENGYWVEAKNVTKNDPRTFIKLLNKSTSYQPKKRIHTFTHVLYIPSLGYSLINFLNEKMASQFFYQGNGLIWLDTDTEDDEECDECEENEEYERTEETEETESSDGVEEIEENDEENEGEKIVEIVKFEYSKNDEDGDVDKAENEVDEEDGKNQEAKCVIQEKDINVEKFLEIIRQKLKKVDSNKRQYYIFLFHDIENAEKYFSQVNFIYK